jgi:predicted TIM-barrel fold metal-dependent hydrolase
MIIDAHLHVWSDDYEHYPFADGRTDAAPGSTELLIETMDAAGVDRAVIVQPIYYLYDNSYVADSLKRYPGKFDALGLLDRHAPDLVEQFEKLVVEDGFSGLRMHLGRPDDPAEWAAPDQDPIWRKAEELGASFLSFGPAEKLPAVEPIIARFPGVKVVLDHIGGAPTDEEEPAPLLANVLKMAQYPNVYVKFTPQGHKSKEEYPFRDTFPAFRKIYDAFGPQRLMWGTDFPHVMRGIGYVPALDIFREHMDFLTAEDKEWLFGKTALSVWKFGA